MHSVYFIAEFQYITYIYRAGDLCTITAGVKITNIVAIFFFENVDSGCVGNEIGCVLIKFRLWWISNAGWFFGKNDRSICWGRWIFWYQGWCYCADTATVYTLLEHPFFIHGASAYLFLFIAAFVLLHTTWLRLICWLLGLYNLQNKNF